MSGMSEHVDLILDGTRIAWHEDRVRVWERGGRIAPITIDMALTRACNYACHYCYAMLQENDRQAISNLGDVCCRLFRSAYCSVESDGWFRKLNYPTAIRLKPSEAVFSWQGCATRQRTSLTPWRRHRRSPQAYSKASSQGRNGEQQGQSEPDEYRGAREGLATPMKRGGENGN